MLFIIAESFLRVFWTLTTLILSLVNPSASIIISSSTALTTSIAILLPIESFSKLKISCVKLGDWIFVGSLPYEKTWKQSLIEKNQRQKGPKIEKDLQSSF